MSLFLGPEAALNATPRAVVNPKGISALMRKAVTQIMNTNVHLMNK